MDGKQLKAQPVRGTQDFFGVQAELFRHVEEQAWNAAKLHGYEEISTPIFEFSDVFHRSLGETSDAVAKETYDFIDRGGEKITLRPEGTAGVARAFISNGLQQHLPLKLYYAGPMFRYERPQKGRFRQFHQVGVENLGPETPTADVECIALGMEFLAKLGLGSKTKLELNTLGDAASRASHREALVAYLSKFESELSADSKVRLQKNPLRILDSKDAGDRKILEGAPSLAGHLNDSSKKFFDDVRAGLDALGISVHHNDGLVRGLDYYTHTVFEITTEHLGAQSAVLAGGRYNGLVELLGGPATPGVGWASGMERLMMLLETDWKPTAKPLACVLPMDPPQVQAALKTAQAVRAAGLPAEILESGNMGKKMKRANKMNATWALIIGEEELKSGQVNAKNLTTGEQKLVTLADWLRTAVPAGK